MVIVALLLFGYKGNAFAQRSFILLASIWAGLSASTVSVPAYSPQHLVFEGAAIRKTLVQILRLHSYGHSSDDDCLSSQIRFTQPCRK